jgi:hypothetical protein
LEDLSENEEEVEFTWSEDLSENEGEVIFIWSEECLKMKIMIVLSEYKIFWNLNKKVILSE